MVEQQNPDPVSIGPLYSAAAVPKAFKNAGRSGQASGPQDMSQSMANAQPGAIGEGPFGNDGGLGEASGQAAFGNLGQDIGQGAAGNLGQSIGQATLSNLGQTMGQATVGNLGQGIGQATVGNLGQGMAQAATGNLGQGIGQGAVGNLNQGIGQVATGNLGQGIGQTATGNLGQGVGQATVGNLGQGIGHGAFGYDGGVSQAIGPAQPAAIGNDGGVSQAIGQAQPAAIGNDGGLGQGIGQGVYGNDGGLGQAIGNPSAHTGDPSVIPLLAGIGAAATASGIYAAATTRRRSSTRSRPSTASSESIGPPVVPAPAKSQVSYLPTNWNANHEFGQAYAGPSTSASVQVTNNTDEYDPFADMDASSSINFLVQAPTYDGKRRPLNMLPEKAPLLHLDGSRYQQPSTNRPRSENGPPAYNNMNDGEV